MVKTSCRNKETNISFKTEIKLIIILDFERNSVVASAFAQEQTQAPVGFHPGVSFDDKLYCRHDNHSFSFIRS